MGQPANFGSAGLALSRAESKPVAAKGAAAGLWTGPVPRFWTVSQRG